MAEIERVQWWHGGGSLRSLVHDSRVHWREAGAVRTLCGTLIPRRSRENARIHEEAGACQRCERAREKREAAA